MLNFVQYNFILNSLECLLTDVRQRVLIVIMEQVKVKIPNINIEVLIMRGEKSYLNHLVMRRHFACCLHLKIFHKLVIIRAPNFLTTMPLTIDREGDDLRENICEQRYHIAA